MNFLERAWLKQAPWLHALWPLAWIFQVLSRYRQKMQRPASRPESHTVPVIVIGNISVGGTGKTPLLMALANHFLEQGIRPGIISRGYGGSTPDYPLAVTTATAVDICGDEALLMLQRTGCPVVVDPDRESALRRLLENESVDVILSDDGLQHYRLHRDIEIAVVDGQRLFGNHLCLPAGPLREPVSRLRSVDYIVVNAEANTELAELESATTMELIPRFLINLGNGEKRLFAGAPFSMGNKIQAVSAIGNPERFYQLLNTLPYQLEKFSFRDHHLFSESDFEDQGIDMQQPVVMTEKDAVKCRQFAKPNFWYLSVDVKLQQEFLGPLLEQLEKLRKH
ncbi:MAG TPA: tetraacyldisaccharide 4'-kinase [Gammaproteobacteria bacterium]|nr:tetraacyldisaccharide 4'-kinase [Gammaproteobacteria bacterium]